MSEEAYDPMDDVEIDPELEKLVLKEDRIMSPMEPQINAAIEYWISRINSDPAVVTKMYTYTLMDFLVSTLPPLDAKRIEAFRYEMKQRLPDFLTQTGWNMALQYNSPKMFSFARILVCDPTPKDIFREIVEAAEISTMRFPKNVVMRIDPDEVTVMENGKWKTIWPK